MADIYQKMKSDGIDLGNVVELTLEEHADLDHTGASLMPWYVLETKSPIHDTRERRFIGYVCEFEDRMISICPGWVERHSGKCYGAQGSIKFSPEAIASYKLL